MLVPWTSRGGFPPRFLRHPLNILFDHPGTSQTDFPIWCPGKVSKRHPWDTLIWCPRDVPERLIRDILRTFSERPLEDLKKTCKQQCGIICSMFLNFFLFFFQNLFDWLNLFKNNSKLKVYLEHSQTSKM